MATKVGNLRHKVQGTRLKQGSRFKDQGPSTSNNKTSNEHQEFFPLPDE